MEINVSNSLMRTTAERKIINYGLERLTTPVNEYSFKTIYIRPLWGLLCIFSNKSKSVTKFTTVNWPHQCYAWTSKSPYFEERRETLDSTNIVFNVTTVAFINSQLDIEETTVTASSASFLDLFLEFEIKCHLCCRIYYTNKTILILKLSISP